jgi:hypothetical protein
MAVGAGVLAGRALRGGRGALAGLALVVALGGGASLGAAVAAHRTDHAYGDYVRDAELAELVVNPSLRTKAMDAAIRSFDGVDAVHVDTLLFASALTTKATKLSEAGKGDELAQVRGSVDGRYVDIDRPAIAEGREPSGEREVFVSTDYRPKLERLLGRELEVGGPLEIGIFWPGTFDLGSDPETIVEPLGTEMLRISGFGTLPNEVLPEELYPREQLVVSQDVTRRYFCLEDLGDATDFATAYAALIPEDCASTYDYYALSVRGGAEGVRSIRRQFDEAVERLNAEVAPQLQEQGIGYYYISQDRADQDAAVRETTRPTVLTLQALALVAALATLTVAGLMVARQARRDIDVHRSLRSVGATRGQIARWATIPPVAAAVGGLVAALMIAYASSPLAPVGTMRGLAPSPGPSAPAAAVLPVAGALAVGLAAVIAAVLVRSSWRASRGRESSGVGRQGRIGKLVRRGRPALSTGVGAAVDGRRAGAGVAAMLGCVVATAAAAAAIVYGASLADLVDEPQAYGWPWDVSVITGAGYGDTETQEVEERLARSDVASDVVDHSHFSFDPSLVIADRPTPTVFGWPNAFDTELPVLEGRAPERAGETLLGEATADVLDLGIGDEVDIESNEFGPLALRVVGIGVMPTLGPFVADRAGLGTGAFTLVDAEVDEVRTPSLTGIRLRDGVSASAVLDRLRPDLKAWDASSTVPVAHDGPVRPPEIVDVSDMRLAPLVLGGGLLLSLTLGLWLVVTLSVRDRRRELAVLRAIGFGDRDVQSSVRWQGLTLIAVGVVFGVPLGIIGGRYAWQLFADRLGVVPGATVPLTWLALEVTLTLLLGLLAVTLPARAAARVKPAEALQVA